MECEKWVCEVWKIGKLEKLWSLKSVVVKCGKLWNVESCGVWKIVKSKNFWSMERCEVLKVEECGKLWNVESCGVWKIVKSCGV